MFVKSKLHGVNADQRQYYRAIPHKIRAFTKLIFDFFDKEAIGPVHFAADYFANRYDDQRVKFIGPDFACLEWLLNCGSTSVTMSNGLTISSQKQMRKFLAEQGIDPGKKLSHVNVIPTMEGTSSNEYHSSVHNDLAYNKRYPHISPIHIKAIDATDAVITDRGFRYFKECRRIERLKMNHCYYFGNMGLKELAFGRAGRTITDLEIVFNARITDEAAFLLSKMQALNRLHLYFLISVKRRDAVLRHLRISLPKCEITFPETFYLDDGADIKLPLKDYTTQRHRRI